MSSELRVQSRVVPSWGPLQTPDFPQKKMTIEQVYYKGEYYSWRAEGYWNLPEWEQKEWMDDPKIDPSMISELLSDYAHYPLPVSSKIAWPGKEEFIQRLKTLQDKAHREADGFEVLAAGGDSTSRLEPNVQLGGLEYRDTKQNVLWTGDYLEHYIKKHNVIPSKEFYDYVMGNS